MTSRDILSEYLLRDLTREDAETSLDEIIARGSQGELRHEAALARQVKGFIRRYAQYGGRRASVRDLLLNLRNLLLSMGRIQLNETLYNLVKLYGQELNLIPESNSEVIAMRHIPDWLTPKKFIDQVYTMKNPDRETEERWSAGDELLRSHTIFTRYKSFEQKLAVYTALSLKNNHTLLLSQPTGGGKSLVTQMLIATTDGLTIVIVPTVALALDQYAAAMNNLRETSGILIFRGDLDNVGRIKIFNSLKNKEARVLFTSPEALLKNNELRGILDNLSREGVIRNVVIDEAHIVPDWGTFFRPDFQLFSIVLRRWKEASDSLIRTYLLSATLSDDVIETLMQLFGTDGGNIQLRFDELRKEPRFYFYSAKSRDEQDQRTFEAIKWLPKPMVIYVLEPKEAKAYQKKLKEQGYNNIPIFTGDTKDSERDTILTDWKSQAYDIVIATSAFGIGVDKPDVRTIIHACCPENLSRYYQEVGRGGRDGLPSLSLLLPYQSKNDGKNDVRRALNLVKSRVLTVETSVIRWNSMLRHPSTLIDGDLCILDTSIAPSSMTEAEANIAGRRNATWNINLLLFLYRTGFVDLKDVQYFSEKDNYTITLELVKSEILSDTRLLTEAMEEPRQQEFDAQMQGYRAMRNLVSDPKRTCWGATFEALFPMSEDVCNGCPVDEDGRITHESRYKLRNTPEIEQSVLKRRRSLDRCMGSYRELLVQRHRNGQYTEDELNALSERINHSGIGAVVASKQVSDRLRTRGIVLDYDEFFFAVERVPYLFAAGVIVLFEAETSTNISLYRAASKLSRFDYDRILYLGEEMLLTGSGKKAKEIIDGYTVSLDRL